MELQLLTDIPMLPERPLEGHKGLFGRVLIVGGQEAMPGAPALAGLAALRMGAALVQVATVKAALPAVLSVVPELIGLPLRHSDGKELLIEAAERADAIVVGPGLGQSKVSRRWVKALIRLDKPLVIDADALNILAEGNTWPAQFTAKAVLTPHPGEMKRLGTLIGIDEIPTDDESRVQIAAKAAGEFGQIVVLKGYNTVVSDGHRAFVNKTGNSALSKAGTGDVLSGMLGALLALNIDPFDAACLAVHLHGRAGEIAGDKLGLRSVLARDVTDAIGPAIARLVG